jgi:iron complex transport system substrate-binding protein
MHSIPRPVLPKGRTGSLRMGFGPAARVLTVASAFAAGIAGGCTGGGEADRVGVTGRDLVASAEAVDDAGRTVRLDQPAERVVSLLPAATETLIALGAGDRLIARTDYDDAPEVANLPTVGGGLTPNLEILTALRPDLVIVWEETGGARVRPRLEALGIRVFALATRDTAGIFANVERFGRLLGMSPNADSLAAAIRHDLAAIQASVRGRPPPTVLYMVSMDPPMVAGPNLFIGEMIGVAGGANVFPELVSASPHVSLEEIVARRPDVLLIPAESDSVTLMRHLERSVGWRHLLAAEKTRVRILPPDLLHRPGPSIVDAAWTLRGAIHPEVTEPR